MVVLGLIALTIFGMGIVEEEVSAELETNPVVTQHLGTIHACELAWGRSMQDDRQDFFHYDCHGDKGDGKLEIHSESLGPGDAEQIIEGVLVMPTGERHDIMAE